MKKSGIWHQARCLKTCTIFKHVVYTVYILEWVRGNLYYC